jgi:UDP-glucose 4-epimerase
MRFIVTGASGFIGRNVLLRAPRDWEIVAVYHRTTDLAAFIDAHELHHVRASQCDLTDAEQARRLGETVGRADAALYLAANGDPAASALRPQWDLASNTMTLLNFLEHCPVDHVVYLSSGAVYDGLAGPVTPASAVSPRLPYAISKLASEQYVRFHAERRGEPASYVNVRFFGAYGPYEPARKITTRWLLAIANGQREFTLRGNGRNLIDFMHVDDAVDGFLRLVTATGERRIVDFASGAPATINEIVAAMARACGVSITVRHEGHTEEYIEFRSVDTTMRDRFGVRPSITFEEGFRRLRAALAGEVTESR